MGCVVGAGRHEVVFAFKPKSFRTGACLSALGMAVALGFVATLYWISRARKEDDGK